MRNVTTNDEQRLYVIPCESGFTCYGYDNAERGRRALSRELNVPVNESIEIGTLAHYDDYARLVEIARKRNAETGWRSVSELTPQLCGLEGKRVKVTQEDGETRSFIVGKSTGFIPCHLEIETRHSSGGEPVYGAPFRSVTVISPRGN